MKKIKETFSQTRTSRAFTQAGGGQSEMLTLRKPELNCLEMALLSGWWSVLAGGGGEGGVLPFSESGPRQQLSEGGRAVKKEAEKRKEEKSVDQVHMLRGIDRWKGGGEELKKGEEG